MVEVVEHFRSGEIPVFYCAVEVVGIACASDPNTQDFDYEHRSYTFRFNWPE